jgi:SAM-dependent methyltransferase
MDNTEQIKYWNGDAGKRWAQDDEVMARLLRPVTEALLDHAGLERCCSALDVGCGGGSQSLLLAQRMGAGSRVLGVDISAPMLAVAQEKADLPADDCAALQFLLADAATHDFPRANFDLLFSRFGVMFFADPEAAFINMRAALQPQGRLAFCCWQAMKLNDWTRIPLQAALQHLPPPEPPPPNAPGPFALADAERTRRILEGAGFTNIALQAFTPTLRISEAPTLDQAALELARIGPVSRLLENQPQAVLDTVLPAISEALAPYYRNGALEMAAAVWLVTADNP